MWRQTDKGNVEVLNETIDLYRYFDATKQVEFLYNCFTQALQSTFPAEIRYLERYDAMQRLVKQQYAMPDAKISLLIRFLTANKGVLSKRAREQEFAMLTAQECANLEELYASIFGEA